MIQFLPRASFGLDVCGTLPVSANACRSFIRAAGGSLSAESPFAVYAGQIDTALIPVATGTVWRPDRPTSNRCGPSTHPRMDVVRPSNLGPACKRGGTKFAVELT